MTKSDGTMSALIVDFAGGGALVALVVAAWAKAESGISSNATAAISRQSIRYRTMAETLLQHRTVQWRLRQHAERAVGFLDDY